MSKPRIAVAGFQHETNTFAPLPTTFDIFERGGAWPGITHGQDVIETFGGLNIPIGGVIDNAEGFSLVPILWANAEPGGYVAQPAFDRISAMICEGLAGAGDINGLYLDLHGAMVTEDFEDGEGELLRRIREVTGPELPVAVSLDLHGNLTAEFVEHASVLAIYRTYPHVDMAATGARAAKLLKQLSERGKPFAKAFRQLDYLIPIQAQSTMREPGHRLYKMLEPLERDGVISVDLAFGFPPADITHCGASIVAFAEDQARADMAADKILAELERAESEFHNPLVPAGDAVREALDMASNATRPIVVADPQDNPGAGATGDTTGLLKELVKAGARKAAIGMVWDPQTAEEAHGAGVGAELELSIGGRFPQLGCTPLTAKVRVEALSDGVFTFTGPMYGGAHAHLGKMAQVLVLDESSEVRVVIGSNRCQNADQAIFTHMGINPPEQSIVVVKSAVHFLADYEPIAEKVIFADSPGANPCQLDTIAFTRLRAGVRLGPGGPEFKK
ncbi:MAG: M81 family metallopeptidase [Hyphomicrobiales bacterium]